MAETESCDGVPWQRIFGVAVTELIEGEYPTPTVVIAKLMQPEIASKALQVYVVVEDGVAVTVAPVEVFNPKEGVHE